ncbi:MAG: peptidase inhibitor I78 [Sphingomonadales bacterium]|nr:peptidase inhibitor I78 [Sphingomonadales bacterium]
MRAILVLPALMILPACAATGTQGPATPSETAGNCEASGLDAYVGRKVTSKLGAELLAKSGARSLRWGAPGMAMTMDFRPDRLTVSYDEQMLLTSARCG